MKVWTSIGMLSFIAASAIAHSPRSEIYVGPQGYYAKAHIGGISPHFHGSLWGAVIGYQYMKPQGLYFRLEADWAAGRMRSHGNPSRYLHDENVEGVFGYAWQMKKWRVIPYIGYAFHYLIESREATAEYTPAKFKYQTYNLPVGFWTSYAWNPHWELGIKAQWAYNIDPAVAISQLSGALWTLDHKQGVRVDLPLQFSFGDRVRGVLRLNPFYQWYQLGASSATSSSGTSLGITTQTWTYWGGLFSFGCQF